MGKISKLLDEVTIRDIIIQGDKKTIGAIDKTVKDMRKKGKSDDEIMKKLKDLVPPKLIKLIMDGKTKQALADVEKNLPSKLK